MSSDRPEVGAGAGGRSERRRRILFAVAVAAVAAAVYANTLFNGFVHDDFPQVVQNPWVKDIRSVPRIFSQHVGGFEEGMVSNYYRPVMYLLYLAVYAFLGPAAWGFHLLNVLLHAGVTALVFVLAGRLLRTAGTPERPAVVSSLAAAALFAVHPVHTETVAWIASLPDLFMTLCLLLALYFHVRAYEGMRVAAALSLLCFLAALFTKEPALVFPAVLIAHDLGFHRRPDSGLGYVRRYGPFAVVAVFYFALRWHALGGFSPRESHVSLTASQYVINVFPLFTQYLSMLVLPVDLNFFHVFRPVLSLREPRTLLSLAVSLGFCVSVWLAFRRNGAAFLGFVMILLPLLPVLYIPGVGANVFAERYLYFPSVGFVLLAAVGASRFVERMPRRTAVLAAVLLVAAAASAAATVRRNAFWKDNVAIWTDTVRKSPDAPLPHYQLADELFGRQGRVDEAIVHYEIAAGLQPDRVVIRNNLGLAYHAKGWNDKALAQFQAAVLLDPASPSARNNLGLVYKSLGRFDLAIEQYQAALRLAPANTGVLMNLGNVYELQGMRAQAAAYFAEAFRRDPQNPVIRQKLSQVQRSEIR